MDPVSSINSSGFASHFVLPLKLVTFAISSCTNQRAGTDSSSSAQELQHFTDKKPLQVNLKLPKDLAIDAEGNS